MNLFAPMSKSAYEGLLEDARIVQQYDRNHLLPYVVYNHLAAHAAHRRYTEALQADGSELGRLSLFRDLPVDLISSVLNWLASMLMFLDHSAHAVSQRCGARSDEVKAFKAATTWEFDNGFAYRFLSKLRNYAQHEALPLHTVGGKRAQEESGEWTSKLDLAFDRDALLRLRGTWGVVHADLAAQEQHFPVLEVLDAGLESLTRLADHASRILFPTIDRAAANMERARLKFVRHPGDQYLGRFEETPTRQLAGFQVVPLDFAQVVRVGARLRA